MVRRTTNLPPPQAANLSVDQMRRGIVALQRRITDLEPFDPQSIQQRDSPEVIALETAIEETLSDVFGHGSHEYNRYHAAINLDNGPRFISMSLGPERPVPFREYLEGGRKQSIVLLQQAIRGLEERILDHEAAPAPTIKEAMVRSARKVFVVHGHDEAALQSVARFLEKIGLEAIILREEPDAGRTIIEKFEECAADVGFAVILLTPDDLGGAAAAAATGSRARQNVIFELGYFAGKLGRGRACLMRKGAVEIPSDLHGVIYTDLDQAEGWKLKLVKELKAAKLDFDANRVW